MSCSSTRSRHTDQFPDGYPHQDAHRDSYQVADRDSYQVADRDSHQVANRKRSSRIDRCAVAVGVVDERFSSDRLCGGAESLWVSGWDEYWCAGGNGVGEGSECAFFWSGLGVE